MHYSRNLKVQLGMLEGVWSFLMPGDFLSQTEPKLTNHPFSIHEASSGNQRRLKVEWNDWHIYLVAPNIISVK